MIFPKKMLFLCMGIIPLILTPLPVPAKADICVLKVAVTPELYNSGLLSLLIPPFEKKNKLSIEVLPLDSKNAIEAAERGDVDAVLIEDSEDEMSFMENGFGTDHTHFVHSYYVILGPPSDPAKIKGEKTGKYAFYKISEKKALFISRGDHSEIDLKEKMLWENAYVKKKGDWYIETGKGTDETMMVADEKKGYMLSDKLTFASMKDMVRLDILVKGEDPYLRNTYNVIAVNSKKYPHVKQGTSLMLIEYLTSKEVKDIINGFNINGEQLFYAGE